MYLMVDLITKLPLVVGKNVILVVYDRLSKICSNNKENISREISEVVQG